MITTIFSIILIYLIIGTVLGILLILCTKIPEETACIYLIFMLFLWPIILSAFIYEYIKSKIKH